MQNYRNNAMPYNVGCGNSYNGNYRNAAQMQVANVEQRTVSTECCTLATESKHAWDNNMVLAMAYVKWQKWHKIYDAEKALRHGTIFEELDFPFCGIGGCQK